MKNVRLFPRTMKYLTLLASFAFLAGAVFAQPTRPTMPPANFVLPDLSTVPGAVTFTAEMFDLEDSNFKYDGEKWMSLDVSEHMEGSVSIKVPVSGSYTIVIDAAASTAGFSSFAVEVDDEKLAPKIVPMARDEEMAKRGRMLMWPEVEISPGATVKITGKVKEPRTEDAPTAKASWARMLLLPHNNTPGGPPMGPPPAAPQPEKAPEAE